MPQRLGGQGSRPSTCLLRSPAARVARIPADRCPSYSPAPSLSAVELQAFRSLGLFPAPPSPSVVWAGPPEGSALGDAGSGGDLLPAVKSTAGVAVVLEVFGDQLETVLTASHLVGTGCGVTAAKAVFYIAIRSITRPPFPRPSTAGLRRPTRPWCTAGPSPLTSISPAAWSSRWELLRCSSSVPSPRGRCGRRRCGRQGPQRHRPP